MSGALSLLDEVYAQLLTDANVSETILDKLAEAIKLIENDEYDNTVEDEFGYGEEDEG